MINEKVFYSWSGGDEQFTPKETVECLLPYIQHYKDKWDIIISNPPYKNKRVFWERCLNFNKPFCLLMPVNTLSDSLINSTMKGRDKDFQLLIPSRRTCFYNKEFILRKSPSFKAVFYGVNIFKQQIILAEMKKQ